ncbi:hypothetical protein AKJ09_05574 [Labilithrix luteola]|uniref:DUF2267 domain-containing protein n=1 Tax=Labilithrix luteola TaxID=1391654 RepID=A0A0K1PZE8_9BACT|nr:DUF2267 domain-containing protein [Labilithrix luteola]AKU98910.1 hypothetical protein AKJ09_05574 [Labilithrix luteola]
MAESTQNAEELFDEQELVRRVCEEGGIGSLDLSSRVIRATLFTLGQRLGEEDATELARRLPEPFGDSVVWANHDGSFGAAEFYERVRKLDGESRGFGLEHAQVVLRVVGTALTEELRERLARALPSEIARVMQPAHFGEPPPYGVPLVEAASEPLTSLASGRSGSRHPVSEAAPPAGQSHSVVREANPHGDVKLSSAQGMTQERLGRALADGHGGPPRPISEAHDEEAHDEEAHDEKEGAR